MTEVFYDESTFPEYAEKLARERKGAVKAFLGGVAAYLIAAVALVFLIFPDEPQPSKTQGVLILLAIPVFFGIVPGVGYWLNQRHPRRVTEEAIEAVGRWTLADIHEVVWRGPDEGVEIHLDPEKHWIRTGRIDGADLLRPNEFLRALEGRVPITREEPPTN